MDGHGVSEDGNYDVEARFQKDKVTDLNMSNNEERRQKIVLVLVNPCSGRGKSVAVFKKKLMPVLESLNIDHHVFTTDSDSRVHDYLCKKSLTEITKLNSIIVVSGDGLLHETINALLSRADWEQAISVPIAIIPTGSGNGLAYSLVRQTHPNIFDKNEVIDICCKQAIQDQVTMTDLVKITYGEGKVVWSFLSFGWGLLADIDIDSEWLRLVGEFRFTIYGLLRSITAVSYRGRLSYKNMANETDSIGSEIQSQHTNETLTNCDQLPEIGNGVLSKGLKNCDNNDDWIHIEDKFSCLYAVYQSHVSSVTKFSPKSTPADQLIYLTYIRGNMSPRKVIEFLLATQDGSHGRLPYVTVVPVQTFVFEPLEPSKVVVDGEVIPWSISDGPMTAKVVHNVVKILWKS